MFAVQDLNVFAVIAAQADSRSIALAHAKKK
jgi:hypothetical protein